MRGMYQPARTIKSNIQTYESRRDVGGGNEYPATGNLLLSAQFVSSSSGEVRHLPHLAPRRRLPFHRVTEERNDNDSSEVRWFKPQDQFEQLKRKV